MSTQRTQQQFNDPFIAIVVDPVRSIGAGKVEIGAFRTFPEGYTNNSQASEWQSVPSDRIEDFGVHANCYYQLEMSFYKSSLDAKLLDLQWRKYWVNTLAASPLTNNRDYITSQICDVAEKIEKAEGEMGHGRYAGTLLCAGVLGMDVGPLGGCPVENVQCAGREGWWFRWCWGSPPPTP